MPETDKKMKRVNLDKQITQDDYDKISGILKRKLAAERAIQTSIFPKETEQRVIKAFYQAGLDNFADAQSEELRWWNQASSTYQLPPQTFFDMDNGVFYLQQEDPDAPELAGEAKPHVLQ
jgi:hypothetical protein